MKVDTKVRFLKVFMFLFSICCITVSVYTVVAGVHASRAFAEYNDNAGILQMLGGIAIFLTTFLGCYAILSKSPLFLWIFAFLACCVTVTQLTLLVARNTTKDWNELNNTIHHTYKTNSTIFGATEQKLQCCGLIYSTEYQSIHTVPRTCYQNEEKYKKRIPFLVGCIQQLKTHFYTLDQWGYMAGVLLTISETVLVCISTLLAYHFYRENVQEAEENF